MLIATIREREKTVNMAWEESHSLTVYVFPLRGGLIHRIEVDYFYSEEGSRVILCIFGMMANGYYFESSR